MDEGEKYSVSVRKKRSIAKSWSSKVVAKDIPFRFRTEDRQNFFLKEAPWCYIDDLPSHVLAYLDSLDR